MLRLKDIKIVCSKEELAAIPDGKVLINTINAHSYNTAQKDDLFAESLTPNPSPKGEGNFKSEGNCVKYLIPDGASVVKACRWLKAKYQPKERIAGWDLFEFEMGRLEAPLNPPRRGKPVVMLPEDGRVSAAPQDSLDKSDSPLDLHEPSWEPIHKPKVMLTEVSRDSAAPRDSLDKSDSPLDLHEPSWDPINMPKVMFMGSSEKVLGLIREKAKVVYPHLEVVTYSPPYKPEFTEEDNAAIIKAINDVNPDLLWIGMTAPKQEKWAYSHWDELDIHCHCGTIGAVFDFFAGTAKRAPKWWQEHSLEWLYRLIIEPKRMWRRYIIGNALFLWNVWKER
jgi:exopolysaccharide biosynthesis WecB/TagA/CpsF family protein